MIDRITEQPFCQTRVSGSTFVNADCFDVFPFIEDKSIDAIICDLPYGTTACKWDSILPLDKLWKEYKRVIKPDAAIILFASQPFTTTLISSNIKDYRYNWVWNKLFGSNFGNVNIMPLKFHEDICIFYQKKPTYNKQIVKREKPIDARKWKNDKKYSNVNLQGIKNQQGTSKLYDYKNPTSILEFSSVAGECNNTNRKHPTQKPIELLEYLVKTYTNENDMVLDNTMGSGTTNLACIKLNRKSIGIEKEKQYYDVAVLRASEYCH